MRKQRGDAELVISLVLFLLAVPIWMIFSSIECHSKWGRAGMTDVAWGPMQGCLVKLPDGRWMPEDRIREVDIPKEPQK